MKQKIDAKKYIFKPYDPIYKKHFQQEKSIIKKVLPDTIIEHVGSTSVPGLGGKGIIDIAIKTPNNKINYYENKLSSISYFTPQDHPKTINSIFLKRKIKYNKSYRWVHVHLVLNNTYWNSFIVFRDYLKKNPKIRDEYAKVKKEGAKLARGEKEIYRKHKKSLIENIMKKALEELK